MTLTLAPTIAVAVLTALTVILAVTDFPNYHRHRRH
jgi:hypothetical protein